MRSLTNLFSPRSIAVIGGRAAESVVVELRKLGYTGDIWPVNPRRADMDGITCFARLEDLPGRPDCAYVAVARDIAIETIALLSAAGCGGAICHASGFSEVADGKAMTARLIAAAGAMPVLGPNCWGMLNLMDRTALWPDFHGAEPVERGVAIVNQSGNMAINYTMQRRGLPLALVVTLGNQVMIDPNDCIEHFLTDDRITAIGLHIEGMTDIARFSQLAIRAREIGKPIVALKTGASAKGARATVSHTATLAGADDLYDALFARYGVARAHSVPGFLETLKLVSTIGPLTGNRIASLSCSGGEASLIADRIEATRLQFPDLTPGHAEAVRATLNEYVDVTNPLDYHTFIWGKPDEMTATFAAMLAGGFDLTCLILDYPRQDRSRYAEYDMAIDSWIEATAQTSAKSAIIATLPECLPEAVAQKLAANGIVAFAGMDEALAAMDAALLPATQTDLVPVPAPSPPPQGARTLNEHAAKHLLAGFGIPVPRGSRCAIDDAGTQTLAFPAVVKALSDNLTHKSEHNAVRLNLQTSDEVTAAANDMRTLTGDVLVEEMVTDGIAELIVGVNRDPQFGLFMVLGTGGVLVELLHDSAALLLPATRHEIEAALRKLKTWPLLTGYRGGPPADIGAVIDTIEVVARFAAAHEPALQELDINPLIIRPEGKGAVAADAMISMGDPT